MPRLSLDSIWQTTLPARCMAEIAAMWRNLAGILEEQSERKTCNPVLFRRAGETMSQLADAEESFFEAALEIS